MSEKRAVNSSEPSLDDECENQSLATCLRVYDVEKLDDDADTMLTSVCKSLLLAFSMQHALLLHEANIRVKLYNFTDYSLF